MVVVAVLLGFFIGGGPSLLSGGAGDGGGERLVAATTSTTATSSTTEGGASASTVSTTTTSAAPPAARPAAEVGVKVYNGSSKPGQAVVVGDRVKAAGYQLLPPGPSPSEPLGASVIHFAEGYEAEAAAFAGVLELPASAVSAMPTPAPVKDVGPANLVLIVADDLVASP